MPIDILTRAAAGRELEYSEVDANFTALRDEIDLKVTIDATAQAAAQAVLTQADRMANYGFFVSSNGTNSQTLTDATWVALVGGASGSLQAVDSNVGSVWSADSTGRFTPPAGRWLVGGSVCVELVVSPQRIMCGVRKNGAAGNPHRMLARTGPASASNIVGISGCTVVAANGTDYFEIVAYVDGSGTHNTVNTAGYNSFYAQYLGPVL